MLVLWFTLAAADLTGVASKASADAGKVGGSLLGVAVGYLSLKHAASHSAGKIIGVLLMAIIPALAFFGPGVLTSLLHNSATSVTK